MIDVLKPLIKKFLPFAKEKIGFEHPPKLFLRGDSKNAQNPLGKTAFYDPGAKSVTLYITGRHPKDVMRSLSHELVHHKQYENDELSGVIPDIGGPIEDEANAFAGRYIKMYAKKGNPHIYLT